MLYCPSINELYLCRPFFVFLSPPTIMNKILETLKSYIEQHPELTSIQIKEEISRQLKGEIFPGEIDEIYNTIL